eukprot:241494_1
MDRHIVMFLALLLFGSSVLAMEENSAPTWFYWSTDDKFVQYPQKHSELIEKAYQSFLAGERPKQFGQLVDLQIEFPREFKDFSHSLDEETDKLMIDFKDMRQYVQRVVSFNVSHNRKKDAKTNESVDYRAIRRVHLGGTRRVVWVSQCS